MEAFRNFDINKLSKSVLRREEKEKERRVDILLRILLLVIYASVVRFPTPATHITKDSFYTFLRVYVYLLFMFRKTSCCCC